MENIIWKTIPQYPKYQASNDGQIRSSNYRWFSDWRIVKPRLHRDRLVVNLHQDGMQHTRFVHHLVLWAFVGECPNGMEACHWDDNGINNNLSNLRWDTHKENIKDKVRNGKNKGEGHSQAKLNWETVNKIRGMHEKEKDLEKIASVCGSTRRNVWNIVNNKSWIQQ